jgi:hypothetical protein
MEIQATSTQPMREIGEIFTALLCLRRTIEGFRRASPTPRKRLCPGHGNSFPRTVTQSKKTKR